MYTFTKLNDRPHPYTDLTQTIPSVADAGGTPGSRHSPKSGYLAVTLAKMHAILNKINWSHRRLSDKQNLLSFWV